MSTMKGTIEKSRRAKIWNAIHDGLELEPDYGADGATKEADEILRLAERGLAWEKFDRRKAAWNYWRSFLAHISGYALAVIVLSVGFASAIYFPLKVHANDYASIDPGSVADDSKTAITNWYGHDNLPNLTRMLSKEHSNFAGKKAWKAVFSTRGNRIVCAYVWRGKTGLFSKVQEGRDCQ